MSADFYAVPTAALARRGRLRRSPASLQLSCLAVAASSADVFAPVAVGLAPHPALSAVLGRLGARAVGERAWRVDPLSVPLSALLRAVPPQRMVTLPLDTSDRRVLAHRLAAVFNSLPSWRARIGDLAPKGAQQTSGPLIAVRAERSRLVLTLFHLDDPPLLMRDDRTVPLSVNRLPVSASPQKPVLVPAPLAAAATAAAISAGMDVWDRSKAGVLSALSSKLNTFQSVHALPYTPGVLLVNDPASAVPLPMAADMVAGVFPHATPDQVAARTLAVASARGRGRPGLFSHQDLFVSCYSACALGMICALPPGSGKTRAAVAALLERSSRESGPGPSLSGYRALIVVPAGLRSQWEHELAVMSMPFRTLSSSRDSLAGLEDDWGPLALLASFDIARDHPELPALRFNDLVVDEATVLFNQQSARSTALWGLRSVSGRALLLSATPDGRSKDHLGVLACFVHNDRDLFGPLPLSRRRGHVEEVLGPLLFKAAADAPMPSPVLRHRDVTLSAEHLASYRAAKEHLAHCLLTNVPHSTLAAAFRAVRIAAVVDAAGGGAKIDLAVQAAAAAASRSRRVLVFTDFEQVVGSAKTALAKAGLRVSAITGSRSHKARASAARALAAGDLDVLVVGPAGHVGLNLQAADVVIHLDTPTDLASFTQRNGRAIRLSSTSPTVDILVPTSAATVETRLFAGWGPHAAPLSDLVALALAP